MVHGNSQTAEGFLQLFKKNDLSKQERQELEQFRAEKRAQQNQQQRQAKFLNLEKKGEVYIGKGKDDISDSYKIGFTHNGSSRQSQQSNSHMRGFEYFYTQPCIDAPLLEKLIHNMLKRNGYHTQKEWFNADYEYMRDITEIVGTTLNTILCSRTKATKEEIMQKIQKEIFGPDKEIPFELSDSADSMEVDLDEVDNPFSDFFYQNFQITRNLQDFVQREAFVDIYNEKLQKNIGYRNNKDSIFFHFQKYLLDNNMYNYGRQYIDGEKKRVFKGIKVINH